MSEEKSNSPAAKPAPAAAKPPKKLQPRTAANSVAKADSGEPPVAVTPPLKKPAAKKPSRLEETKARNKKALSEALVKAQAVKIPPPPMVPQVPVESAKAAKPAKPKKIKLVRHSFSMPETEYAQIAVLKKRIADFGGKAKRSELVRAGIAVLSALDNVQLTAAMARVESIKIGRPKK